MFMRIPYSWVGYENLLLMNKLGAGLLEADRATSD